MLLAKITPTAKKVYDEDPFNQTTVEADYMCASVDKMVIGADVVSFDVRFGTAKLADDKTVAEFNVLIRKSMSFTSDELKDWGTDDSVTLDIIAAKLKITIVEKTPTNLHFHY